MKKKTALSILAVIASVVALTGCAEKDAKNSENNKKQSEKTTTVSLNLGTVVSESKVLSPLEATNLLGKAAPYLNAYALSSIYDGRVDVCDFSLAENVIYSKGEDTDKKNIEGRAYEKKLKKSEFDKIYNELFGLDADYFFNHYSEENDKNEIQIDYYADDDCYYTFSSAGSTGDTVKSYEVITDDNTMYIISYSMYNDMDLLDEGTVRITLQVTDNSFGFTIINVEYMS